MILETIELIKDVNSNELMSIETLQTYVNDGKFDDILTFYDFLIMTNVGICLVKQDKSILINATVDLSSYVKKQEGYSLISNDEIIRLSSVTNYDDTEIKTDISKCALKEDIPDLSEYAKLNNLPSFSFDIDGTLIVTINGETHRYTPETTV